MNDRIQSGPPAPGTGSASRTGSASARDLARVRREESLARALRENLKRRRTQARARRAMKPDQAES